MDRSSFRNIYDICFYLISFIINIPKIAESREYLSVHTALSAHVPVSGYSENQYPKTQYPETQYRCISSTTAVLFNERQEFL